MTALSICTARVVRFVRSVGSLGSLGSILSIHLALILGLGLASPSLAQTQSLLTQVLKEIAAKPVLKQRFVERKFISQLDAPVDSTGELAFIPPARLQRRAITPYAELTTIDTDQVTIERGTRKHSIAMAQAPQLGALSSTLIAVIKGDAEPLTKNFVVQGKGSTAQWSFVLTPRDAKAVGWLREIRLSGQQGNLELFELHLADGDRSVTRLMPLQ